MDLYFDRDGRPLDLMGWSALHRDEAYKRVAVETVGEYTVSTVWLGLDHSLGIGPPIIFETMVFLSEDWEAGAWGIGELETRRYCTEAEALVGHEATVILLLATEGGTLGDVDDGH